MLIQEDFERIFSDVFQRLSQERQDEVVFAFPVNLNVEGRVQEAAVIFGKKALYRVPRGEGVWLSIPFEKLSDAQYRLFQGGAACEVCAEGKWMEFCRASGSDKKSISQLVRILRELTEGVIRPEDAVFVRRYTACPQCGAPYPKGSSICNRCTKKNRSASRLLQLIRPQIPAILLSIVLFFATTLMNVLLPRIQGMLVDDYLNTSDPAAVLASFSGVLLVVGSMALIRILSVLFSVFRNNTLARISNRTVVILRRQLYEKVQSLSVSGISRHTAGDLLNRVSSDPAIISTFLTNQLPNIVEQLLTILFVSFLLFSASWELALFILIPVPFVILLFRLVHHRNAKLYHRHWVENANANTLLHDIFQGVRVVKVFGTEKREVEKYDEVIRSQKRIAVRNEVAWAKVVPFADFLIQVGNFILLYYVGNQILNAEMSIGQLTAFSAYVNLIYGPLRWMANLPRMLQRAFTAVSKVFEVLDEEPDVPDRTDAVSIPLRGEVRVEGVWFGYDETANVLENVSVSISPGEMLGIVGRSGAGKSTLINLIMRLYDVDRGRITVDGYDVRDLSQNCLRSQIGVVLQETFLFEGSVFENIAYAKPDATYDEVLRAARLANAHNFIMKLPDGYDTGVGERGYTLSGGERQRIAIARAILHDPKILILDEATSALDTETEKLIQEALARLCANRTTIAIAHRLSTLRGATKLLVLDQKTVAEIGTHEELMQNPDGIYHSLVIAQREMNTISKKQRESEKRERDSD